MKRTKALVRLFAVLATITAMLVPAATASAIAIYSCDGEIYDATNPAHILYGDQNTTVDEALGQMVVDARGADGPRMFFWDGHFRTYEWHTSIPGIGTAAVIIPTMGVKIFGSRYDDLICGTDGEDDLRGRAGNDLILSFGNGEDPDGLSDAYNAATGRDGDRLIGGKGNDTLVNGTSWLGGTFNVPASESAFFRGGKGNDTITGAAPTSWPYVDVANGGSGDDTFWAWGDEGLYYGKGGNDSFRPTPYFSSDSDDCLYAVMFSGGNGNDSINLGCIYSDPEGWYAGAFGGKGDDTIWGGMGSTSRPGVGDWQWMFGGEGNDTISGGGNGYFGGDGCSARLLGGPGDDVLNNGRGCFVDTDGWGDFWDSDQPNDAEYPLELSTFSPYWFCSGVIAVPWQTVGFGGDPFPGASCSLYDDAAHSFGGPGNDTFNADGWPFGAWVGDSGMYGTAFFFGGDGNDTFNGGLGRDYQFGQNGNDTFNNTTNDQLTDISWGYYGDDTYNSACWLQASDDPETEGFDVALEHYTFPSTAGGSDAAFGYHNRNLVEYDYNAFGADWDWNEWENWETRGSYCGDDVQD